MKIPVRCKFRQKHCKHKFTTGAYSTEKIGRRRYLVLESASESNKFGILETVACQKCGKTFGLAPPKHPSCRHIFYPYPYDPFVGMPHYNRPNRTDEWLTFARSEKIIEEDET